MAIFEAIYDLLWGDIIHITLPGGSTLGLSLLVLILVPAGIYFTIRTRFLPFRMFPEMIRVTLENNQKGDREGISGVQALIISTACRVGMGNLVGVVAAISAGGAGAVFWMWVTALVGMMTKFAEIILAMKYREKTPSGRWVGGAMYFIRNGLGRKWAWMGVFFSVFGIIACVGTGNLVQVNAIAVSLQNTFSVPTWVTGIVLLFLLSLILLGGVKRIGAVAGRLVPFMAAIYIVFALIVIAMNITEVPRVFWWVVSEAFTPTSAEGGFAGATVLLTIRMGVARGIFSNEAGLGSTPMAHAAATAKSPLQQASIGMLDVFIDTIIVCSMTGFAILVTGVWNMGADHAGLLTHLAFEKVFPNIGGIIVTCALSIFAFTTVLGWAVYGERCVIYLFGDHAVKYFRIVFCLVAAAGCVMALNTVWLISDTANALMAFPNLIGILLLSPKIVQIIREEVQKDPSFKF